MIIASIATHAGREKSLLMTLRSIREYVDEIWVHENGICDLKKCMPYMDHITAYTEDVADNGKFYPLGIGINKGDYFLTMDDDLWYAPDYVPSMIEAIEENKCIVTHHGRKLLGLGLHYYREHDCTRCLDFNGELKEIDVAGTGVTGFKLDYFYPHIWDSPDLRMSDLVFSLEAAKQGKKIVVLPHREGIIKQIGKDKGIHGFFQKHSISRQNEIADEIYKLKYLKDENLSDSKG
jgi:hypothetical protein